MTFLRSLAILLLFAACAVRAAPLENIDEQGFVAINGIAQWVTIKGDDRRNPVILFLHGGPGNTMSPYADNIYGAWARDFTLVQWDQRGAGLTYGKNRPSDDTPLTVAQLRDDGLALAEHLLRRLGQRKLILMGGSWSSILGVEMAKARPGLFYAYVGSSHMVSYRDNPPATYAALLALTRAAGDTENTAKLEALGPPPWTDPHNFGIVRRIDRKYEALATDAAPGAWWHPAALYATPQALADYEAGEDYSYLQFVGLHGDGMFSRVDLPALGTRFELPFFMIQGEQDLLTRPQLARRYFDSISAPQKGFVLLPRVGHDPNQRMVDAQYDVLKNRVLPLIGNPPTAN